MPQVVVGRGGWRRRGPHEPGRSLARAVDALASGEHSDWRWTWRMPANPLVRHMLCKNGQENVDLDLKSSTHKTIQKTHKIRWKETG